MKNIESGRLTLNDVEFEELLRIAYESKQSSQFGEKKEIKAPPENAASLHTIPCM